MVKSKKSKSAKKIQIKDYVEDNVIDLSMSNIVDVPAKDIAAFRRCDTLDLSRNQIVELPSSFGLLTHLYRLDLSSNRIRMLPAEIGLLINLRHLDLYNNEMVHLPVEMRNLKQLRYLDVKSNPLNDGLSKIIGSCLTNTECSKAARKLVDFLAKIKDHVDNDREALQNHRADEKPSDDSNRTPSTTPSETEASTGGDTATDADKKTGKKVKPNNKEAKKAREMLKIKDELHAMLAEDEKHKATHRVYSLTASKCFKTFKFLWTILPLILFTYFLSFDTHQRTIERVFQHYLPVSYHRPALKALGHYRDVVDNVSWLWRADVANRYQYQFDQDD